MESLIWINALIVSCSKDNDEMKFQLMQPPQQTSAISCSTCLIKCFIVQQIYKQEIFMNGLNEISSFTWAYSEIIILPTPQALTLNKKNEISGNNLAQNNFSVQEKVYSHRKGLADY